MPQTFTYDVLPGGEPVAAGRHQRLVLRAGPELSPGEGRTPLVPVARRWQAHRGRLDEALTAEICRQAVRLTIDATDLRFADLASMRTLVTAAMKVRTRDESVTLLNPQPPVARMLDLLHVDELFSTRGRAASETRRHQRGRRLTAGKGDRPPGRFG